MKKVRLDTLLVERKLFLNRQKAQGYILGGKVFVNGKVSDKPGTYVYPNVEINVISDEPIFVSRGGNKLYFAIETFGVNVLERVCLDIGASTGGFTDCLLKKGARHVFSVDVGYGQLDYNLRNNHKVTCVEKTNARYLEFSTLEIRNPLAKEIDLVTIDVSFISVTKIIGNIKKIPKLPSEWIILFKPQFELKPQHIKKGGKVKNVDAVTDALISFNNFMNKEGFKLKSDFKKSPLAGKKSGNVEYFLHYELL